MVSQKISFQLRLEYDFSYNFEMFSKVSRHHRQCTFLTDLLLNLLFYIVMQVCLLIIPTRPSQPPYPLLSLSLNFNPASTYPSIFYTHYFGVCFVTHLV